MEANSPQGYYCPACNKNIISPYSVKRCPECGGDLVWVRYTISENEHGGEYEIRVDTEAIE